MREQSLACRHDRVHLVAPLPRPDEATHLAPECRAARSRTSRDSRRGYNHRRLYSFGNNVQLDFVTRGGKTILRSDPGGDFENTRYKFLESRRFGGQWQLFIGAQPHSGLAVPLRPDLETPSLVQALHADLFHSVALAD